MVKKIIVAIFSVLVLSTVLAVCNTTHGVSEDTSGGGNAISDVTTKAQQQVVTVRQLCRVVYFFCDSYIDNS